MKLAQIFDAAKIYEIFQFALAKKTSQYVIINEILKPDDGISSVLDFGCGIGYHSKFFPNADYLVIEPIESCIAIANKNYADSSTQFILGDNSHLKNLNNESYDLVIALGVLHHIDDEIFNEFIRETHRILKFRQRARTQQFAQTLGACQ